MLIICNHVTIFRISIDVYLTKYENIVLLYRSPTEDKQNAYSHLHDDFLMLVSLLISATISQKLIMEIWNFELLLVIIKEYTMGFDFNRFVSLNGCLCEFASAFDIFNH